ncbi:MAG: hypothetical protein II901_00290 [Paludibacteraceae bacterium]|nr:hypothetical protein [Paludibacteraceae bacterium]
MKYRFLIVLLAFSANMFAYRPQSRAVIVDTVCNAPLKTMLEVTRHFCYQFQACPDSLFTWAYLGLGEPEVMDSKTKEGRNVIQLEYKDRTYDPKLKTGDVAIDIYVLGVRWWKNQHLGTKLVLSRPAKSQYPLTAHMTATYSGSILEGGDFIMRMEPISEKQTRIHYEFRLVFGKVLSTFISDKMWQTAMEWRFTTILENLVECAETGTVQPKLRGPQQL